MYFKFEGSIDMRQVGIDLANNKVIRKTTIEDILHSQGVTVTGYLLDTVFDECKKKAEYYDLMHPRMQLNEDWAGSSITASEIKVLFKKFFAPLASDSCEVTIVDPYIFANNTNITLLAEILKENVKSKKLRFIRNASKDDLAVHNNIKNDLTYNGFVLNFVDAGTALHDRWWYTRINGFAVGTSFNGLTRKDTTIKMLDNNELNEIIAKHGI